MAEHKGRLELNTSPDIWRARLQTGERSTLARLITYSESSKPEHQALVQAVLQQAPARFAHRVAFSGAPGVGKSTLIEALGCSLVESGQRLFVLSVDPTSQISGGSILADKTRMQRLSAMAGAFIRPSPAGGALGGVTQYAAQTLDLCDHAGFDWVFVETVGVGQSELDAAALVDNFVLVVSPAAGDELQGIKRGITEHADLVVVNKADQDPSQAALTQNHYQSALHLMRGRAVSVLPLSALSGQGLGQLLGWLQQARGNATATERQQRLRRDRLTQLVQLLRTGVERELRSLAPTEEGSLLEALMNGSKTPAEISDALLSALRELLSKSSRE